MPMVASSMTQISPPVDEVLVSRRGARRSQRRREELAAYLFLTPWLVGFIVFYAGPMIYSFWLSLFQTDLLSTSKFVGAGNYRDLIHDPIFRKSLRVTATYTALFVPIGTALALGIALLLNQKIRFQGFWRTVYYLPAIVSGAAVAVLWSWVLNQRGLVNQALRLVGIHGPRWFSDERWALPGIVLIALWGAGANMLLYLGGLQSIPTDVKEAASVDGATNLQRFRHVILPLLTPTLFYNVTINLIAAFQVFNTSYIVTDGGPNNATSTLVYYLYKQGFQLFEFGYASAIAWVLFAIILVFTLILVKSSGRWVYYEGGLRR